LHLAIEVCLNVCLFGLELLSLWKTWLVTN
jgi:hypothetical protein